MVLSVVVDVSGTVAVISGGLLIGSSVSTKVMTDEALKCVHPLPVMTALMVVPAAPAPGEITETAAGGLVAIAEPVRDAVGTGPPGAVLATVSMPVRVVGVTELGTK